MKPTQDIPIYLKDPQGYKKMEKQEDLHWSPPTRRQEEIDHWLLEDTSFVVRRQLMCFQLKHKMFQKNGFY
jgi:hypothetical protein